MDAIKELQNLSKDVYSINHLYWWTLKYEYLYKRAKETKNLGSCYGSLPCACTSDNPESIFISFYEGLFQMTEFHKHENYFQEELKNYNSIAGDEEKLKEWVLKNEKLGTEDLFLFLINHLDYDENSYHPIVGIHEDNLPNIFVNRNDFKNTIEALEIFADLYWDKKILPENLRRLMENSDSKN